MISAAFATFAAFSTACARHDDARAADGGIAHAPPSSSLASNPSDGAAAANVGVVGDAADAGDAATRAAAPIDAGLRNAKTVDDAEKATWSTYRAALGEGREATRDKHFAAAVKAYDRALAALPGDPRALAERGYARLDAKDYAGALRDLEEARAHAPTPELEAQIWFNLGLAEEGLGHAEAARRAFARVQSTVPSTHAAMRLIGKSACDALVDPKPRAGKTYPSWLALARALEAPHEGDASAAPKTNDEARARLCEGGGGGAGDRCAGDGPWIVAAGGGGAFGAFALVVPLEGRDAGKLVAWDHLGEWQHGRCAQDDAVTLARDADPKRLIHVRVVSEPDTLVYVDPSTAKPCEKSLDGCQSACFTETWTERDLFFDPATRQQILTVEQSGREGERGRHRAEIVVAARKDGIAIKGGGCDRVLPLPAGADASERAK